MAQFFVRMFLWTLIGFLLSEGANAAAVKYLGVPSGLNVVIGIAYVVLTAKRAVAYASGR